MKAWMLDRPHQPLRLVEAEPPIAGPGQVVIKNRAAGLCHGDVDVMEGVFTPAGMAGATSGFILGHENAGVIAAVGEGVTAWKPGDAVAAAPCHDDSPGGTHNGGFAEYFRATASRLVRIPDGMDWGQAAAATDAGLAAYTGIVVRGEVQAGDRVGIVGLGGLGLIAARIATALGAEVYAAEPREAARQLGLELGVEKVAEDVAEFAGLDLDVVADFAGFGTTTMGALRAVKAGGRVVLVGLGSVEFPFNSFDMVLRNVDLRGSASQGNPEHLQAVIDMIGSGDLSIRAEEIGFDDIPAGLDRLKRGEVIGRLYATLPE